MKVSFTRLLVLIVALAGATAAVQAQDLGAIRGRMEQRLPQIDALKASGALGENNRGFVEVRESQGDAAAVASAENEDRTAVYAAIGARTGATPDAVGRHRAKQIAKNSAPGMWIQAEDGSWSKK